MGFQLCRIYVIVVGVDQTKSVFGIISVYVLWCNDKTLTFFKI